MNKLLIWRGVMDAPCEVHLQHVQQKCESSCCRQWSSGMPENVVPELDVLIATVRWLWNRGCRPVRVSRAGGSEAGRYQDQQRLQAELAALNVPSGWYHSPEGPDVVAIGEGQIWEVECKGAGRGVGSTQRNNFDRAIASVVSYYGGWSNEAKGAQERDRHLAIALPSTRDYMIQLRRRLGRPLRNRIGLWVLLLDPGTRDLVTVAPDEDFPVPAA